MRIACLLFLLAACAEREAAVTATVAQAAPDPESCYGCHAERQPGIPKSVDAGMMIGYHYGRIYSLILVK